MPEFQFEAANQRGKVVKGRLFAESEAEARQHLVRRKYEVVKLKPLIGFWVALEHAQASLRRPSLQEVAVTTRQLAVMLRAGVALPRALQVLNQQPLSPAMRSAWTQVESDVHQGNYLSRALNKHKALFGPMYVGLCRAGETTGALHASLAQLADLLEKEVALRARLVAALTYPCLVFVISVGLAVLMVQHILPEFLNGILKDSGPLPFPTWTLVVVTNFFANPKAMLLGLIGAAGLAYMLRQYLATPAGRLRWQQLLLQLPVVASIQRNVLAARFSRSLASLVGCGIPVLSALELTGEALGHDLLKEHLEKVDEMLKEGASLATSVAQVPLFPKIVVGFLRLGEESATVPTLLTRLAEMLDQDLELSLQSFTATIEPLMVIVMGLFVGYVLVALFLPIYRLMGNF